jgi:hypothetical protein
MKTYRRIILAATLIILASSLFAQRTRTRSEIADAPPYPIPPEAHAEFCSNVVVPAEQKESAFLEMQTEGCQNMQFVELTDGYWLAFGTRVIRQ